MLNVNFIGRLGDNAEIKSSEKTNRQFVTFRVAVNGFSNGERTTTWVRVTDFSDKAIKMASSLTKGSGVNVIGRLDVRPYTSTKDNSIQISYDVVAYNTDFASLGGGQQNTDNTVTTTNTITAKVTPTTTIDCGTLKRPETVQITSPSVAATSGDADEDLPF